MRERERENKTWRRKNDVQFSFSCGEIIQGMVFFFFLSLEYAGSGTASVSASTAIALLLFAIVVSTWIDSFLLSSQHFSFLFYRCLPTLLYDVIEWGAIW